MTAVYADSMFLINFIVNYLLLTATARLCAAPPSRWRFALAAALGGAYAVAAVFPQLGFLNMAAVQLCVAVLMLLIAFGRRPGILRVALVFLAVSAAFGGVIYAVTLTRGGAFPGVDFKMLLLWFAVSYGVISLVFRRVARQKGAVRQLRVGLSGRTLEARALTDTGHSLSDPITGKGVVVMGASAAAALFTGASREAVLRVRTESASAVLEALSALELGSRFRLIPYSAVGVPGGMLLAFRPDTVHIDGRENNRMLIALSPNDVSDNGTYSALVGV